MTDGEDYTENLERVGDNIQSDASRMAEWILNFPDADVPYEVAQSARHTESLIEAWTRARVKRPR